MSGALLYTDVNLLPLGETIRNLPDEVPLTEILTEISGKTCRNGSRVVATDQSSETTETSVTVGDRRGMSLSDDLESLVEVAGVETELSKLLIFNYLQLISFSCFRFAG